MPDTSSFHLMLSGLQKGEQQAATEIVERFASRLLALAHTQLDSQIRQKVGPDDVVQSVFKSFFARFHNGKFDLKNWESLWGLLVIITVRKCIRQQRRFHGAVSDVKREVSLELSDWQTLDRFPNPEEGVLMAETIKEMMAELNERERQVCELRLNGHSVREISETLKRSEYAIEGILKRIRKKLRVVCEQSEVL